MGHLIAKDVKFLKRRGKPIVVVAPDAIRADRFQNARVGDKVATSIFAVIMIFVAIFNAWIGEIVVFLIEKIFVVRKSREPFVVRKGVIVPVVSFKSFENILIDLRFHRLNHIIEVKQEPLRRKGIDIRVCLVDIDIIATAFHFAIPRNTLGATNLEIDARFAFFKGNRFIGFGKSFGGFGHPFLATRPIKKKDFDVGNRAIVAATSKRAIA
ncbi:MAG TPA: hypothetical protein DCZ41_01720 [Firmicutes bacterium]|nr:hypothetical protein [Bacillota bacterium]